MQIWILLYSHYGVNEGSELVGAFASEEECDRERQRLNDLMGGGYWMDDCELKEKVTA